MDVDIVNSARPKIANFFDYGKGINQSYKIGVILKILNV